MKRLLLLTFLCLLAACHRPAGENTDQDVQNDSIPALGFWVEDFLPEEGTVRSGETFTGLMTRFGMSAHDAFLLAQQCDTLFDVRKMRAGNTVTAYYSADSTARTLEYLMYQGDRIHATVFKCRDSLALWGYDKPVEHRSRYADVEIESSLWNDFLAAGASPLLVMELDDIFAWTVDFFGLQKGDRFRTFYDETLVDGDVIAIQAVNYADYQRHDKYVYAIRFDQGDGGNKYWSEKGESLKKAFLKAPLKFTRISSRFTYSRKHPIYGTYRAHTGVDYAAPAGTPVYALGDGVVLSAGWGGDGGNTIKIRHNSVYTTAYLHLRGFAKGIKAGVRVAQGERIGYVGSTGASTGPHLDFRVWKNGTPVDPLTLESPSAEPAKEENLPAIDSLWRSYQQRISEIQQ